MKFGSTAVQTGWKALLSTLFLFAVLAIYWPGLSGDFFLDDYPHIVRNSFIQLNQLDATSLWTAANSTNSGPLRRPLAMASFAINHSLTGLDPFYFKLTNLIIHLLTGLGIFLLIRQICSRFCSDKRLHFSIALATTMLWLVHPLNVSTVMYAVQRMTGMAALFTVWGIVSYCHGRARLEAHPRTGWLWMLAGLLIGGIGLFAKETAALILGYLLVIEWLVFRFEMPSRRQRYILQAFFAMVVALPLLWASSTHLLSANWLQAAYAKRAFTLDERLLTETRVLWDYIYATWLPNIQRMGLYHDDYPISHGLLAPASTAIAIAGHFLLIFTALALRTRFPLLLFAVAWFYAGHSVEASILPLEIKYEHRNYLPMLGMLLLMVHGIHAFTGRLKNPRPARLFILGTLILTFSGSTFVRSSQFGDFWGFSSMEALHHPGSSRANQNAAFTLIKLMTETKQSTPELIAKTNYYLQRSAEANPNSTAPLFTALLLMPELTHQAPSQELFTELLNRLESKHPDANINSYFVALLRKAEEGKLQLDSQQVHMLFERAESNPYMPKGTKADIIASRAAYAQSVEHDNPMAIKIIDRALRTDPSRSGIYVPAVWIYQEAGMWQDAARFLQRLQNLDVYGIEQSSIAWLSHRQTQKK